MNGTGKFLGTVSLVKDIVRQRLEITEVRAKLNGSVSHPKVTIKQDLLEEGAP